MIVAPVVSEKSYGELNRNWYTFLVSPDANKTEIKIAIEQIFNVTRHRRSTPSTARASASAPAPAGASARTPSGRSVKLADGDRIDAFGGPVS